MDFINCHLGRAVWVAQGSYGWRAGFITGTRIITTRLSSMGDFQEVSIRYENAGAGIKRGNRHPCFLRPRDLDLKGKDKPKPPSKGG